MVWRGGRPFKQPNSEHKPPNANGESRGMVVSLSNDEGPAPDASLGDTTLFDDEEEEYDPSEPYLPIVQTLDLTLGIEVLYLAFPHLPATIQKTSLDSLPAFMSNKLICVLTCSDFTIRVLTVPLIPPSPQSKARPEVRNAVSNLDTREGLFGERMLTLTGDPTHRSIPKGVSITITANTLEDQEDDDMEDDEQVDRLPALSRTASRSRSRSRLGRDDSWNLLIASHSSDLSGLLLIYKVPLAEDGVRVSSEHQTPWRRQNLASPAVTVEFNTALYPAARHSLLLVAEAKGNIRILDSVSRSRAAQGLWLVSLHSEFETSQDSITRRRPILDAKWVLGGKSILVLLADGKYGIWDIENAGPKSTNTVNAPRPLTTFALDGWVCNSLKSRPMMKGSATKNESKTKLVPMTPSTRKMKQEALFAAPITVAQLEGPARGGLSVCPVRESSNGGADDESVLFWHESNTMIIPSLLTHWQNKVRQSGNLFGTGAKGEPLLINNVQLGGESCNEIGLLLCSKELAKEFMSRAEILVTGEHRLLIITPPLVEPAPPLETSPPPLSSSVDQQLLARGELDVHGMDRILAGMSNGEKPSRSSRNYTSNGSGKNLLMSF